MIMSGRCVSALLVVLIVFSACASVGAQPRPNVALVEKRIKDLGPLPFKKAIKLITLSPTGERLAYVLTHRKKSYLICDGRPSDPYDYVNPPVFSGNGRRVAVRVSNKNAQGRPKAVILCDGREVAGTHDSTLLGFSPDGRLVYVDKQWEQFPNEFDKRYSGGKGWVVVEDQRHGVFDSCIDVPSFSGDGAHMAFIAREAFLGKWIVFYDGQKGASYFQVGPPVLSPDGARVAYCARKSARSKWALYVNGKKTVGIGGFASDLTFSPDGTQLACVTHDPERRGRVPSRLYVDGVKKAEYDTIGTVTFSPDSQHLAYAARGGKKWLVVRDGKEGVSYDHQPGVLVFSPDSRHLAHIGWRGTQGDAPVKWKGAEWFVVCDGKEGPPVAWQNKRRSWPYSWPERPVFSPDSKHLAWFATRGKTHFIVIDGIEGPKHALLRIPLKPHVRIPVKAVAGGTNYPKTDKFRYVVGDGKEAWLVEVDWPKGLDWTNGLKAVEAEDLAEALRDWIGLIEADDAKAASTRWAKDKAASRAMRGAWGGPSGIKRAHKTYNYRKWLERAKAVGTARTFKVGGHEFGHLHIDWEKTADGWRIARVSHCW